MNGPHDMGGFTGFGPVEHAEDEPVWHADWEPRAFALVLAMGMTGSWNIDEARHARERLPAMQYWRSSYYEMRHYALILQLIELGLVTAMEEEQGRMAVAPKPVKRVATAEMIPAILATGSAYDRPGNRPQGFDIGEKVRVQNINPEGHTRLPRYARGKSGEIVAVHGMHVFPDSNAQAQGEDPQWLYTVRFTGAELWGKDTRDSVCIDLWEPYLEAC
ncbi:MAG: nitrile hydratase subunit beta [Aestuariivirga sp.]|uniref:nitrile hydratase subunit beta n=1 Tax=Aestuariivirga sp. TaxID=2650926 RepID=UPI0025BF9C0A|nr:nitrile hydratase subunit beta [Aestuariivirga sp.]MCA3560216.1 nitrile hydratase subunit beta [Aestuariivirga sp.]